MSDLANYLFGYTEEEARRLARQAAFIEDLTADVLRRAGLKVGMRVLDLGCGVGDVSLLAANMVGATGAVLGIDRSAASIETARRRTAASHIGNVIFAAAELDAFDTDQTFDAVIGRLVLLHQRDPSAILRRFRRFLKPGGLVAFQEMDVQLHLQVPASQLFTKVFPWIIGGHKADGSETNMDAIACNLPEGWAAASDDDHGSACRERTGLPYLCPLGGGDPQYAAALGAHRLGDRRRGGDRHIGRATAAGSDSK